MVKVTDEAVKAALTAWVCGSAPNSNMDEDMRAALTAALPHLQPVDVAALQEAISSVNIHDEANGYEWRGDGGDYTPKSHEKAMLEDFGHSLISQIEDAIRALK